jgi:hypothetical protein
VPVLAVETGVILIIIVLVALPIGAFAFAAGAGNALKQVGRGGLSLEGEPPPREDAFSTMASSQVREEEIRQMVEARSYRAVARGDEALDVDAEVEKLLTPERTGPGLAADKSLREEVRQLVVARNERRVRQGKEPLDVEAEIERQLEDLEGLGQ